MDNEVFFKNSIVTGQVLINSYIFNILTSAEDITFYNFIKGIQDNEANCTKKSWFFKKKLTDKNTSTDFTNKYKLLFFCGFFSNIKMLDFRNDYKIDKKDFYVNFLLCNLLKEITVIYAIENNKKLGVVDFFNWFFNLKAEVQLFLLRNAILTLPIDDVLASCIAYLLPFKNEKLKIPHLKKNIKSKKIDNFTTLLLNNFFNVNNLKPLFTDLNKVESGSIDLKNHIADIYKFKDIRLLLDNIVNKEQAEVELSNTLKKLKGK